MRRYHILLKAGSRRRVSIGVSTGGGDDEGTIPKRCRPSPPHIHQTTYTLSFAIKSEKAATQNGGDSEDRRGGTSAGRRVGIALVRAYLGEVRPPQCDCLSIRLCRLGVVTLLGTESFAVSVVVEQPTEPGVLR